jgi:hypothetical protein
MFSNLIKTDTSELEERLEELNNEIEELKDRQGNRGNEVVNLEADTERQVEWPHHAGINFEAHEDFDGLSVQLSEKTRRAHTVILREDGETIIDEDDITNVGWGGWFHLDHEFKAGEDYQLLVGPHDRILGRGRVQVDYPIEGDSLSVTSGAFEDGESASETWRYCIRRLSPGADFSGRERGFSALDDVPKDAEIVIASQEFDLSGDVGEELFEYMAELDQSDETVNHAVIMPYSGEYEWNTFAGAQLRDDEFFAVIAPEGATATYKIRESIAQPLEIGSYSNGPKEAIIRNMRWDIDGEDSDGWPVDTGFCMASATECVIVEGCSRVGRRSRYQWRDGNGPIQNGYYSLGNTWSMRVHALREDTIGVVRDNFNGGGEHNVEEPDDPIAERAGRHGEGVGFSAENSRGAVDWVGNIDDGSVGNVFYMHGPRSEQAMNYVAYNEISDHCRSSIRLGYNDRSKDNYIQLADMDGRYSANCLWANAGSPTFEGDVIEAPEGNHELLRDTSDGATFDNIRVVAGRDNQRNLLRSSSSDTLVEDSEFVDVSENVPRNQPGTQHFNASGCTLRNCVIDSSGCERPAISGEEPEMIDCEIIE